MKKLLPILLLLLAVFYGTPHSGCRCSQTTVVSASCEQHSCCHTKVSAPCSSLEAHVSNGRTCCGMVSDASPVLASSIQLIGVFELEKVNLFRQFHIAELQTLAYQGSVSNMNRAPPRIRGFGSSDTYLFKRALLI